MNSFWNVSRITETLSPQLGSYSVPYGAMDTNEKEGEKMAKARGGRSGGKGSSRSGDKGGSRGNLGWPNKKGNGNKTGPRDNAPPKGKSK